MQAQNYLEVLAIGFFRRFIDCTIRNMVCWNFRIIDLFEGLMKEVPLQTLRGEIARIEVIRGIKIKLVESDDYQEIARKYYSKARMSRELITDLLNLFDQCISKTTLNEFEACPTKRNLDSIAHSLHLTQVERDLLILCHILSTETGYGEYLDDYGVRTFKTLRKYLADLLNVSRREADALLKKESKLFRLGLLERNGEDGNISLREGLDDFLAGFYEGNYFDQIFKPSFDTTNSTHEAFPLTCSQSEYEILHSLLSNSKGAQILLYGAPGTGKSTLSRRVCSSLGFDVLEVKNQENGSISTRIESINCAIEILKGRDFGIILVDEADRILQTEFSWFRYGNKIDKGWLNTLLEMSNTKIIWITNSIKGIEESTLRRFSYAIEFKPLTKGQRKDLWIDQLTKYPNLTEIIGDNELDYLASTYKLSAGPIVDTCKNLNQLSLTTELVLPTLKTLLSGYLKSMGEDPKKANDLRSGASRYNLEGLNTDLDLKDVISLLQQFLKAQNQEIMNLNLLLSGPPGTGKTEFVKYLSNQLGVDLVIKKASELKSPFVGVTEKNIAASFDEAERDGAILFFDEADSFLIPRETARASWEVSETNELLCQMENFHGIFVCSTNLPDNLDSAAIRRFSYKIRFNYLSDAGKALFFRSMISTITASELTKQDLAALESLQYLAPGDYKIARQRLLLSPSKSNEAALKLLQSESEHKVARLGRPIGFSFR